MLVFFLGFTAHMLFSGFQPKTELPKVTSAMVSMVTGNAPEVPSPKARISENDILVTDNKVVIAIDNPQWATFTNTNSMDPVLDENAFAIEKRPASPDDLEVGDIASYDGGDGIIIHRIVEKGVDKDGTYFLFKGDNNPLPDPDKVRFDQIKRVVVGILY